MEGKFKLRDSLSLLKETSKGWMKDDPFTKAAAVAYYAVFSLPAFITYYVINFRVFLRQCHNHQ